MTLDAAHADKPALFGHLKTSACSSSSLPALTSDGTLVISDLTTTVYAVRTDSRGFQAGSPWPRYRHDNRSTGAKAP